MSSTRRGETSRLERFYLRLRGLEPAAAVAVSAALLAPTIIGLYMPFYVLHGSAVQGEVYSWGARITYLGEEWVPGPVAAAVTLLRFSTLAAAVSLGLILYWLVYGEARFLRAAAYAAVGSHALLLAGLRGLRAALEPLEGSYVYETGIGVIDLGSVSLEAGLATAAAVLLARAWLPLAAALLLIVEDYDRESG